MSELASKDRASSEGGIEDEGGSGVQSEKAGEASGQELNDQPLDPEDDLFGGEEEEEEEQEQEDEGELAPDDEQDDDDHRKRSALEYDEDIHAQPLPTRHLHIAEPALPNLPFPKPSDGKLWDLRIPNFLTFNPLPFSEHEFLLDPASHSPEKDSPENDASKFLTEQNVIRWRWKKDSDGIPVKQSNARVICWEDGSQSLQVGSELFDMVFTTDSRQLTNPATSQQSQPTQQQQQQQQQGNTQGLTYLFAQHSELKLLEAQASITGQITLRPYSLNSLTHRSIVANRTLLKASSQRQTTLRVITFDPEQEKIKKEMEEERKLKDLKKQDAKLARQNSRQSHLADPGSRPGARKRRFNAPLLSDEGDFAEEDGEEEEEGAEEEEEYEEEEEDWDDSTNAPRQPSHGPAALTELELAEQRIEQQHQRERTKSVPHPHRTLSSQKAPPSSAPKPTPPTAVEPPQPKITKRKLIIASDDED